MFHGEQVPESLGLNHLNLKRAKNRPQAVSFFFYFLFFSFNQNHSLQILAKALSLL